GLFAVGSYGLPGASGADTSGGTVKGLLYGGNANQLLAQVKGSATITFLTLAAGLTVMYAIKAARQLRISPAGELEGLDIHEHGAPAYHPEPAYDGYSALPPGYAGGNGGTGAPSAADVPAAAMADSS